MSCDICKTVAVSWLHDNGALCDVCKRSVEAGRYAGHPELPAGLRYQPSGSFELVPFPDLSGSRLVWVKK